MIQGKLMLVKLGEYSAYVEMCVSLDLWSLQPCLDGQSLLQKVQSCPHLPNSSVIARHVVECHSHS